MFGWPIGSLTAVFEQLPSSTTQISREQKRRAPVVMQYENRTRKARARKKRKDEETEQRRRKRKDEFQGEGVKMELPKRKRNRKTVPERSTLAR